MFPFKIHVVQQLEDNDFAARTEFAEWCLQNSHGDASFLTCVIYYYEFVFHVGGKVNKHNVRIWGSETLMEEEKQQEIVKNQLRSARCL